MNIWVITSGSDNHIEAVTPNEEIAQKVFLKVGDHMTEYDTNDCDLIIRGQILWKVKFSKRGKIESIRKEGLGTKDREFVAFMNDRPYNVFVRLLATDEISAKIEAKKRRDQFLRDYLGL